MLRRIRDWMKGGGGSTKAATIKLVDPVLGPMDEDQRIKGRLVGHVRFMDRNIELSIDPDGEPMEESLETARLLSKSLINLDKKARSVASHDLLNDYNENWRFFGGMTEDRVAKDVENPALAQDEFEATLLLEGVNVTGRMLTFCYSDKGLFVGHSIFVEAVDGLAFKETNATLFG